MAGQHTGNAHLVLAIVATALFWNGAALADDSAVAFDIEAQELGSALREFALQSGTEILFVEADVQGKSARRISGNYAPNDALELLLADSRLDYRISALDTVLVGTTAEIEGGESEAGNATGGWSTRTPALMAQTGIESEGTSDRDQAPTDKERPAPMDHVVVTGTRIRGGDSPTPVIAINAEDIKVEGFTDLGQVIRSVPQNFAGGQNPGVLSGNLAGAGNANQNITGGSSLNLRGLGADATLTLLNGRRMTYGGFTQSVDISAIPVEAVERIEIVADGASAIYGSDAVGGVGNVILKREYQGVTAGARFGRATQGGLNTVEYNVTAGADWQSGGLIATYKDATVDPIYSRQRSYTEQLVDPSTIYPGSDLRGGLISAHHVLGNFGELQLVALRSERDQLHLYNWSGRNSRVTPGTTTTLVSPSLDVWLANDWTLSIGATSGKDRHDQYRLETVIETSAATVTDVCYCNESRSYDLGAEGPVFPLPAGDARLAVGAGYRWNDFRIFDHVAEATTLRGSESARFAYAEVNLPLAEPYQGIAGVQRMRLTVAARHEDYSTFGGVTTPKLGLIYGPNADLTLKASWGKSFKAPTLFERNYAANAWLFPPVFFGGAGYPDDASVLILDGGNRNLSPERATTRSLSIAYHPVALPGLEAELSWFQVDYRNRVIQPIVNSSQALSDPVYAPFVHYTPTPQEQADVIDGAEGFNNFTGAPYDPDNVAAIIFTQYANVARQDIQGIDLSAAYHLEIGDGTLTLRGSASWLDSTQETLPTQPAHDLAGMLFNPPRVSTRAGASWRQGEFTASVFSNYRGGVINRVDGVKSASFTTFDATLRYATGNRGDAWSGLEFVLSVDNVLDRDPPLYEVREPIYIAPYDSTNYSAIGRFINLSVAKHW